MSIRRLLVLPHLKIHNANALSSPYTIGFPAMTAWLGFTHALQRKLQAFGYPSLELIATAVFSHNCDLQTHKGAGDFVHSIIGTANPVGADGKRPSFIEEARCHLEVSLLIECQGNEQDEDNLEKEEFSTTVSNLLRQMKVASGDLLSFQKPKVAVIDEEDTHAVRRLLLGFMPAFALIERRELMQQAMEAGTDAIDAMLEYLTIHHSAEQDEQGVVSWHSQRKAGADGERPGWIVPIAVGFHGISPLGVAKNQRDAETPHRFAESVVTLGEFKMAHRTQDLDEVLWHYHTDLKRNLYLCQQNIQAADSLVNDGFQ